MSAPSQKRKRRDRLSRLRTLQCAAFTLSAATVLVLGAAEASRAAAASPWWHLNSGSRPGHIDPNGGVPAVDQVQEIVMPLEGGKGALGLSVGATELGIFAYPEALAHQLETELGTEIKVLDKAVLQAALEGPYGAGTVTVTEKLEGQTLSFQVSGPPGTPLQVEELGIGSPHASVITAGKVGSPDGEIYVTASNLGDANVDGTLSPVILKDVVPAGLEVVDIVGTAPSEHANFLQRIEMPCSKVEVTCTFTEALAPFDQLEMRIAVNVEPGVGSVGSDEVQISGGGAQPASFRRPVTISSAPTPFGADRYELVNEEEGGAVTTQAASHPFQSTTTIVLNQGRDIAPFHGGTTSHTPKVNPVSLPKDLAFDWPPGLIGNPTSFPECTDHQFFVSTEGAAANFCPASSAVGVAVATVNEPGSVGGTIQVPVPLFNLVPRFGEPARVGFSVPIANTQAVIDTSLRSDGDYGITVSTNNITQTAAFLSSEVSVWGVPGDPRHNGQRGWACLLESRGFQTAPISEGGVGTCAATETSEAQHPPPFLALPTSCATAPQSSVLGDTWEDPLDPSAFPTLASYTMPLFEGCNRVPFAPSVEAKPTSTVAAAPTGLNVDIKIEDEGQRNGKGLIQSELKKAVVALPEGVTTNPSVANGLGACSLAQYRAEEIGVQSCPESSKVGEVEIESPLVTQVIDGAVYVAKQHDNPADNLLSIYMVAKNPELGVLIKSAGAVTPNPQTGQLTTTFDELPQLPFSHFHFAFRTGQRAPLITPGLCGRYTTQTDLYPYSNPTVPLHSTADFEITGGAAGGQCHTSAAQLPNKPSLEAGTLTPIAGAYSPFVFKVKREDGSQALSTISATLPEGLLGKLAGVKECSNAQIAQAESRSGEGQGALELASPSCPAASEVGVVSVGTGVGTQPYYVQGKAYLAGPYKGAPLSLAIITPAVVGPFDLGTIVVRTALYVNEFTAQITAKSDPIPTIVHGLPTVVQSISLNMNRPNFTLNPTSCEPKQIEGSATSTLGNVAALKQPFQAGACAALGFKPGLKLSLGGQTRRAGHPALKAVLTYPKGSYANIAKAQVSLPGSEFLDQGNLNLVCKQADLKAGTCPKKAIYGKVKAWSPLLEKPLVGNVYLGVGFGYKLPALVAELNGQIRVLLVGKVDTDKHKGIRNTFLAVPDAAVSRFELSLKGGKKYGLLENSENICKKTQKAEATFTAQNGKLEELTPTIANSCGKKGKKKNKAGKSKGGSGK
jgi:hypothetical protein